MSQAPNLRHLANPSDILGELRAVGYTSAQIAESVHPLYDWQSQLMVPMGRAADEPGLWLEPYALLELMPILSELRYRADQDNNSGAPNTDDCFSPTIAPDLAITAGSVGYA